jgi:hypothetical protein
MKPEHVKLLTLKIDEGRRPVAAPSPTMRSFELSVYAHNAILDL